MTDLVGRPERCVAARLLPGAVRTKAYAPGSTWTGKSACTPADQGECGSGGSRAALYGRPSSAATSAFERRSRNRLPSQGQPTVSLGACRSLLVAEEDAKIQRFEIGAAVDVDTSVRRKTYKGPQVREQAFQLRVANRTDRAVS